MDPELALDFWFTISPYQTALVGIFCIHGYLKPISSDIHV
jgi:hypothetical protein